MGAHPSAPLTLTLPYPYPSPGTECQKEFLPEPYPEHTATAEFYRNVKFARPIFDTAEFWNRVVVPQAPAHPAARRPRPAAPPPGSTAGTAP
eukprot:scaffold33263_cov53-Phaeocystis_antarctica.AAC.3